MEIGNPKPMTVKDILEDVKKILSDINVPIPQIESIGIPVTRAISGIQICIDAFERQEQAEQEKQESVLEVVKDETDKGENDA